MIQKIFIVYAFSLILIPWSLGQSLPLSTSSDSAMYYYRLGWEEVLNQGHFSRSEAAYRKMYAFDAELLVGAALLARITPDRNERAQLFNRISNNADRITGDEKKVLELFLKLTQLYIYRENEELPDNFTSETLVFGEAVLRDIAKKYPDDWFYQSEYIEFVHANQGPQSAISEFDMLFNNPPPFMVGYKAQMLAELGQFEAAWNQAKLLEEMIDIEKAPYSRMVRAKIHHEMGNTEKALMEVNMALEMDSGHILAQRLKIELEN